MMMMMMRIRDVSLNVEVVGQGYPLLLIHGGPGLDHWSRGSEIRAVTSSQARLIAAGIEAETFNTLVWTAPEGNDWRQTAVIAAR